MKALTAMFLLWAALLLPLGGCAAVPTEEDKTSKAAYVGDARAFPFDEIVVAVPVRDGKADFYNLHVAMSAMVNPKKETVYSSILTQDVKGILWRAQTRIASAVVRAVVDGGAVSRDDLPGLRARIETEAQKAVDGVVSRWQHADKFEIEAALTSFFVTDTSVGRNEQPRRWW